MAIKITRRTATIPDFIKMKKFEPFDKYRTTAKTENFALMFGAKPSVFRKLLQGSDFTVKDCDDYIRLTHSEGVYNDIVMQAKKGRFREYEFRPEVECKYLAVATVMRDNFLSGYKGLADRITREHIFALNHFYSRNWYGAIRWHPELAYMNIDPLTGGLKGVDKKYFGYIFSHLMNNAANTTVQSGETVFIYSGWINTYHYLKEYEFRSRIFNSIHDSLDVYAFKPEKEVVKSLINDCVHWKRYPFEGVEHRMEPEVSDIRDYEHLKEHFYKHGVEEKVMPIEEAVAAYNEKYKAFPQVKQINWHGCFI